MDNLDKYAQFFDAAYPNYADARYAEIKQLVALYDSANVLNIVQGHQFSEFVELIRPLTAIKNYKSQVPFPEQLQDVICCIIQIRKKKVGSPDISSNHADLFEKLISIQGFQLPTVSAVFHFCHPDHFPIVDVNVKAACALLKARFPHDFSVLEEPILPAPNTSVRNKMEKYAAFIAFISKVVSHQRVFSGNPTYRYIDKALMVIGVPELRNQAENPGAR